MAELGDDDHNALELRLEHRIKRLERIENTVSLAVGIGLAIPYFLWWYARGVIHISCLIPIFIGSAITKLGFSIVEARLARKRKELENPGLPQARLLPARSEPAPPQIPVSSPRPAATITAPEPAPAPPGPGEEPRLLK